MGAGPHLVGANSVLVVVVTGWGRVVRLLDTVCPIRHPCSVRAVLVNEKVVAPGIAVGRAVGRVVGRRRDRCTGRPAAGSSDTFGRPPGTLSHRPPKACTCRL